MNNDFKPHKVPTWPRWVGAVGYVLFIFITLNYVRIPTGFLRRHGALRFSLGILYFISLSACLTLLIKKKFSEVWRYVLLVLVFLFYWIFGRHIGTPEEEIHFFEYGLVGIFFARAILQHEKNIWKTVLYAFILGSACGAIDENLQRFLPTRRYDLHDIFLNVLSTALGLVIFMLFYPYKIPLFSPPKSTNLT